MLSVPPPICPAFDMGVGDCPDIDDILPCSFTIGSEKVKTFFLTFYCLFFFHFTDLIFKEAEMKMIVHGTMRQIFLSFNHFNLMSPNLCMYIYPTFFSL